MQTLISNGARALISSQSSASGVRPSIDGASDRDSQPPHNSSIAHSDNFRDDKGRFTGRHIATALDLDADKALIDDVLIQAEISVHFSEPEVQVGLGLITLGQTIGKLTPEISHQIDALRILVNQAPYIGLPFAYALTYSPDEQLAESAVSILKNNYPILLVDRVRHLLDDDSEIKRQAGLRTLFAINPAAAKNEAIHILADSGDSAQLKDLAESLLRQTTEHLSPLTPASELRIAALSNITNRCEYAATAFYGINARPTAERTDILFACSMILGSSEPSTSFFREAIRAVRGIEYFETKTKSQS